MEKSKLIKVDYFVGQRLVNTLTSPSDDLSQLYLNIGFQLDKLISLRAVNSSHDDKCIVIRFGDYRKVF